PHNANLFPYTTLFRSIQQVKDTSKVVKGIISKNKTDLRKGPAAVFEELAKLKKNDTVLVLGKNQNWFHIQTRDSLKGFINQSFLDRKSTRLNSSHVKI